VYGALFLVLALDGQGYPQLVVEEERGAVGSAVAHVAHDDDGELEALCLVYRHDLHRP